MSAVTGANAPYLLDTNVLSELLRPRPVPAVVERLRACRATQLFASELSRFELRFGASLRPDAPDLWQRIELSLLPLVTWLPVDGRVSLLAGDIAARQRLSGTPAGSIDPLIAATAVALGGVLVTRNVRHFQGIAGLVIENWFESPA